MADDRNTKQDDGIDFRPEVGAQPIKKARQAAATASADGIDFRPEPPAPAQSVQANPVAEFTGEESLAPAIAGGVLGYRSSETPEGALIGGAAGLVVPELLGTPTAQMGAARLLRYTGTWRLGKELAAQFMANSEQ